MEKMKKLLSLLSLSCFLVGISMAQPEEAKELRNISFQELENQLKVFIEFDEGIIYESFTLFNPNRLVIDLINGERVSAEPLHEVNSLGVLRIRAAINRPAIIRIVFDFEDNLPLYRIREVESGLEISFWQEEVEEVKEIKPVVKPKEEAKIPKEEPKKIEEIPKEEPKKIEERRKLLLEELKERKRNNVSIGFLTGFYFTQDETFKEVYGNSSFFFGGEYSFLLPVKSLKSIDAWISFKTMQDTGLTSYTEEELTLRINHFSVSFRYLVNLNKFSLFIGPGIDYIVYKEKYSETFPIESIGGSDLGFHIQGGSYFHFTPFVAAKIFLKYNISKTIEEDVEVNLGGIEWGIGLVYQFNL